MENLEVKKLNISEVKPGHHCDAYHDGKISPSRMVRIEILSVQKRIEVSKKWWKLWLKTIKKETRDVLEELECVYDSMREDCFNDCMRRQFFDWNCTHFIFGKIISDDETAKEPIMFAKMKNGGWYGVNWNYKLDLTDEFRKSELKNWEECAEENGHKLVLNTKTEVYEWD